MAYKRHGTSARDEIGKRKRTKAKDGGAARWRTCRGAAGRLRGRGLYVRKHGASHPGAAQPEAFRRHADAVVPPRQAAAHRRSSAAHRPGHAGVHAASSAPAGEERRRQALRHQVGLRAARRPARGHSRACRRRGAARTRAGAARRHRLRQDLHHGEGDRGDAAPRAHPRAEQDARRAALRRVQIVLPGQRGRVFRLLLRLLPARSLHPAQRHLYRERQLDQRADRPHAPRRDARAARTRRRDHRGVGVVHLRHRLGRDLFGHDLHHPGGRPRGAAPASGRSRRHPIQAQQCQLRARRFPRSRRHHRNLPGPPGGPRLAHLHVRRRGREHRRIRPAHRREDAGPRAGEGLRQFALCDAEADAASGHQGHPAGIAGAASALQRGGPASRSAAAGAAHAVRHRNDRGDGLLQRHRKLFALADGPRARRAAADAVRISAR